MSQVPASADKPLLLDLLDLEARAAPFVWNRKTSQRVHMLDEDGRTYCQVENCSKKYAAGWLLRGPSIPIGRQLCTNCVTVKRQREESSRLNREFFEITR